MSNRLVLKELSRYELGTWADIVYRNALLYPDSEAFVRGPERVTFSDFNARANRAVHALHDLGLRKGDIVGILSWNGLEYAEVFGAAMKGGFVLAHFSPRLKAEELTVVINDSRAGVLFLGPDSVETIQAIQDALPHVRRFAVFGDAPAGFLSYRDMTAGGPADEPEPVVSENDPLTIFYTSGTTGAPRGAVYTHRQKLENANIKAVDLALEFESRHLLILPMFHIGGDSHIWPFFLTGGCNVIMPRATFDPREVLNTIGRERITDVQIVPTQLISLINLPDAGSYDLGPLKRVWYAASTMPVEVIKKGLAIFGPVFLQGYGQTESGPHNTVMKKCQHLEAVSSPDRAKLLASCGQPAIGIQMRVVDLAGTDVEPGEIGEILVKSRRIMSEYWQKPAETGEAVRDGWLYTGDMGYYDERGFIYIADRKKDMIITGGENVYPREVEDILYRHPAVREAAVIGVPDEFWIERVHALVVLHEGETVSEKAIIDFCRERIAHYKAPKSVEFLPALPKSPQGKILKRELRKRFTAPE